VQGRCGERDVVGDKGRGAAGNGSCASGGGTCHRDGHGRMLLWIGSLVSNPCLVGIRRFLNQTARGGVRHTRARRPMLEASLKKLE
jgi:hypothetical protein